MKRETRRKKGQTNEMDVYKMKNGQWKLNKLNRFSTSLLSLIKRRTKTFEFVREISIELGNFCRRSLNHKNEDREEVSSLRDEVRGKPANNAKVSL
jgi:hypothetical protein